MKSKSKKISSKNKEVAEKEIFIVGKDTPIILPLPASFPIGCLAFIILLGLLAVTKFVIVGLILLACGIALLAHHFRKEGESERYYSDAHALLTREPEKTEEAIKNLRLATNVYPQHINAHKALMALYLDSEKYDKAFKEAEEILKFRPRDPDAIKYQDIIKGLQASSFRGSVTYAENHYKEEENGADGHI